MKKQFFLLINILIAFVLQAQEPNFKPYILHDIETELMSTNCTDINNDGKLDFVCTNKYHQSVYWLEQNFFGNYEYHEIDTSFQFPFTTITHDFNADNLPDIVVGGNELALYIQKEDHSFTKLTLDSTIKLQAWVVKTVDIDNDLDMDIIISSRKYGSVYVYENTDLEFTKTRIIDEVTITFCLDLGDINQDGSIDLLTSSLKSTSTQLIMNRDSIFESIKICDSTFAVQSKFGYLNKDDLLDVVCFSQINNEVHFHYQKENLQFDSQSIAQNLSPAITAIIINDIDGNGLNDIIYNFYLGSVDILYQSALGVFKHDTIYKCSSPIDIDLLDYDNDGDQDLIITSEGSGKIIYLDNLKINLLNLGKIYHRYTQSYWKKYSIIGIGGVSLLLLLLLLVKNYKLIIRIERREGTIASLKHKNTQHQLINLNYEKLMSTVKSEAKQATISAKRWSAFIQEYQHMNPNYTQKLRTYQLTKTEFRLAIFIASQLSSPEISELIGVNIETIYVQRQRLAKKLKLNSVKQIESFLGDLQKEF